MALALHGEFSPDYKVKTKELSYCTFRMAALFIAEAKGLIPMWDKRLDCDNTKSIEVLGINYIPPERSIIDMAYSMIEHGSLPNKFKQPRDLHKNWEAV